MTTQVHNATQEVTRLAPLYRVLLHNDDVNDMGHVVRSLCEVFKLEVPQAVSLMIEAHETGVALVKVEPLEHAELHQEQMQSLGLTVTLEPEEQT